MHIHTKLRFNHLALLSVLTVGLLGLERAAAQKIDANLNGMSDVWELIYGASALPPDGDADGDGASNTLEAIAGTSPFDPNSLPKLPTISRTSTNFTVSMPSALGKQYVLQSIQNLGDTNSIWISEASTIARTGTVVSLTAPAGLAPKYFRIAISDVDTDGDGVNDWEEYKLGLDPTKASSNGQLDSNGQPLGDFAYAAGKLAVQNVVTVTATDPSAIQPDPGQSPADSGLFTVTRGGFPLNSITVNLGTSTGTGFATPGLDHFSLPPSVILPVGVSFKN